MKLGEFFIALIVDAQSGELTVKRLISSIGDLEAITVGQIGAFFELANAIAEVTDKNVKAAIGIEKSTYAMDMSTESLQRWQHVAKATHIVDPEAVAGVAKYLSEGLAALRDSGRAPEGFNTLSSIFGMDMNAWAKSVDPDKVAKVMAQIRSKVVASGWSKADADFFLRQAGGGLSALLPVFEMPEPKFMEEYRNTPLITSADIREANRLADQFQKIYDLADSIGKTIARWTAPGVVEVLKWFEKQLKYDEEMMARVKKQTPAERLEDFGYWLQGMAGIISNPIARHFAGAAAGGGPSMGAFNYAFPPMPPEKYIIPTSPAQSQIAQTIRSEFTGTLYIDKPSVVKVVKEVASDERKKAFNEGLGGAP